MNGPTDHGLKNLFGSLPDPTEADEAPLPKAGAAPDAKDAARSAAPNPAPPNTEHGLAGLAEAPLPTSAPPAPDASPDAASTIVGVPAQPAPAPAEAGGTPSPFGAPGGAQGGAPLCVVVVAHEDASLARTLDALRGQTAAALIDVVTVGGLAPGAAGDLASLTQLDPGAAATYGERAALGVGAARGDLVALLDDYAFPATDWAEKVLTHRHEGFAALGSGLGNANPRSNHSWGHMLLEYGAWREGTSRGATRDGGAGPVGALPARNLVFRREALTEIRDLAALLDEDGALAARLAQSGAPLILDEEARLSVLNPSTAKAALKARYAAGRLDGARWAKGLSAPKRLGKAARAALGGYARYKRDRARLFTGDAAVTPKQHGKAVAMAMVAEGFGRAAGLLRGPGKAHETRARLTAARYETLNKTDRRQFTGHAKS